MQTTVTACPRLILLPGMGADARMFAAQSSEIPGIEVLPFLVPREGEPLRAYAARMAETVPGRGPMFVGGVSLGGMVALEMARHLDPLAVFLIASCRSGASVAWYGRLLARLSAVMPARAISAARVLDGLAFPPPPFSQIDGPARRLLLEMLAATPTAFLHWAGIAIVDWESGTGGPDIKCPVYHIHGGADRIIPHRRVSADVVVPGAGHHLNMSHSSEVNAFLRAKMAEVLSADRSGDRV